MNRFITRIIQQFNRLEPVALMVVVLCVFYIGFELTQNEEIYLAFSKAYMNPMWIPGATVFSDFPGTRLLFQVIFGFILKFISFENMAFFGRLSGYILLAFPIAAIARHLKINNVILVFWLVILFIPQQNFFAGEWIFGGFETKTIAYVFVFWSIYFLFKERFLQAVIFAAISIYWHMLVGGWYTLYVFIYLFITLGLQRKFILSWIYAGLILLPFVIYVYLGLISGNENIINGLNIGYLYAYVRNPHHIGLVMNWDYFLHRHAGKVLMAVIAFALAIAVFRKQLPERYKWINTFLIIILAQNLLFLVVAVFDKNGFVAKFYPWRGNSLAMFFFQIIILIMLRNVWMPAIFRFLKSKYSVLRKKSFYILQMTLALGVTMVSIAFKTNDRFEKSKYTKPGRLEVNALSEKLKTVSEKGDMFLLIGDESLNNISIPRKAERDVYYFNGIIPSQSQSIYEWYLRGLEQNKINADIGYLVESGLDKKIDFIVSIRVLNANFLKQVYKSEHYWIYKVSPGIK